MREIAREAGVGVGTLYRHFPTREALVAAVYQDQVEHLSQGAAKLLTQPPPSIAMRMWMDLFADWVATKNGMLGTLHAMVDAGAMEHAQGREVLLEAISTVLEAGVAAGDLRSDVLAEDITASLVGIFTVAGLPTQKAQAGRLLDLLLDGLRPQHAPKSAPKPRSPGG